MNRLSLARALAVSRNCTHLFVSDPVDVEYLCGFKSSNAFLLAPAARGRRGLVFTDFRYLEAVQKHCAKHPAWRPVIIKDSVFPALAAHLPSKGSAVGFQSDVMTVDDCAKMKKECASRGTRLEPVPVARDISDLFIVKTAGEIAAMKKAAAIADRALHAFCEELRPGITEREAAALLDRLCSSNGSEKPSFDTIMLFGKNSALPHGRPGRARLAKGDFVLVDFGCVVKGFCSDMTRTFVFGRASARQKELYALVHKARAAACRAARAGMPARALDAVGRDIIVAAGYGKQFGHGLGHGVGLRIHESPRLSPASAYQLQAQSVVTIEPGVYVPGQGGVRIEDMVLLNKNGSTFLTHFPRELIEL